MINHIVHTIKHFKVEIEIEKKLRKQIYDAIQGPVIESLQKQRSNSHSEIYWKSTMEGHSFKEDDVILTTLSSSHMFPKDYIEDICKLYVYKVFEDSVTGILNTEPALRESMFGYVLMIAVSDKKYSYDEIKLIYEIGMNVFGYSEKDVAQLFASTIQLLFEPVIRDIS